MRLDFFERRAAATSHKFVFHLLSIQCMAPLFIAQQMKGFSAEREKTARPACISFNNPVRILFPHPTPSSISKSVCVWRYVCNSVPKSGKSPVQCTFSADLSSYPLLFPVFVLSVQPDRFLDVTFLLSWELHHNVYESICSASGKLNRKSSYRIVKE